jgi:hypothetical protein
MAIALRRRRFSAALAVSAATGWLPACQRADAEPRSTLLTPAQQQADLAQWRQAVLDRHPRFAGQARLDDALEAAFSAAQAGTRQPLGRQHALAAWALVNPAFRDAHTLLLPWLDGRSPDDAVRRLQFPFGVRLGADGLPRLRSRWQRASDGAVLPAGALLLAINGRGTPELMQTLTARSHGETAALRRHMLTLMWPQWLHAVLGFSGRFELKLRVDGAGALDLVVDAADRWQPVQGPPELPTLQPLAAGAAWLRVPSFDVDDDPGAFRRAVEAAFLQVRRAGVERLVVDVRGNTGGQSDAGAEIVRRFITRPVQLVARARERLNEDNNGWFGHRGAPGTMREFDLSREGLIEPLPEAKRYRGRVAVLIDELTYSAAILFATTMQDHGLARLVGHPTGGHANQTGNMMPTRLQHSGFTVFIATRDFIRPSGDLRVGPVVPDVVVDADVDTATPGEADLTVLRALRSLDRAG